jgi:hypothetical protein
MTLLVVACGGGAETTTTSVASQDTTSSDSPAGGAVTTTTEGPAATDEPVASDADPCTILTVDKINVVFPGNDEPLAAEGDQCLYEGFVVDLGPITMEGLEAEEEPTGWEIRPIEIDGADWAVARIDTNVTEYEKVLDVVAGGVTGTVHLVVQNADIEWGSPVYDGLVDLLQAAIGRL